MKADLEDDHDSDSGQETVENNNDDNGSNYDIDSHEDVDDGVSVAENPSHLMHDPDWTADDCCRNEQNHSDEDDDDEETEEYQSKTSRNEVRYSVHNC